MLSSKDDIVVSRPESEHPVEYIQGVRFRNILNNYYIFSSIRHHYDCPVPLFSFPFYPIWRPFLGMDNNNDVHSIKLNILFKVGIPFQETSAINISKLGEVSEV